MEQLMERIEIKTKSKSNLAPLDRKKQKLDTARSAHVKWDHETMKTRPCLIREDDFVSKQIAQWKRGSKLISNVNKFNHEQQTHPSLQSHTNDNMQKGEGY